SSRGRTTAPGPGPAAPPRARAGPAMPPRSAGSTAPPPAPGSVAASPRTTTSGRACVDAARAGRGGRGGRTSAAGCWRRRPPDSFGVAFDRGVVDAHFHPFEPCAGDLQQRRARAAVERRQGRGQVTVEPAGEGGDGEASVEIGAAVACLQVDDAVESGRTAIVERHGDRTPWARQGGRQGRP